MNLFDTIEKLITEHGSSAILREHLDLLRAQVAAKDSEIATLNAKLQNLQILENKFAVEKPADTCPYCRRPTGQLTDMKPHAYLGPAGVKVGYYQCENPACGKKYDKQIKPGA